MENKFEIYSPPECVCCEDRAETYLYDSDPYLPKVLVCERCKDKIIAVQRTTNQGYPRCVAALKASNYKVNDAIDKIYNRWDKENKMNVKAKFICQSKTQSKNWNKEPKFLYDYKFTAVAGDSEENKKFFASTPSGEIVIRSVRDDLYEPGKYYYVTFDEAEA